MGDILRPYMLVVLPHPPTPSPPPPPTATKSNSMAMLYYGLGVVGTAAVILLIYNILFIRWRDNDNSRRGELQRRNPPPRVPMRRPLSVNSDNINLISSKFKYKKEGGGGGSSEKDEYECAVCLSVFEEGEELRQLPNCKHSFHAPCIDMWLYSHLDCPLCRSPVEPPVLCRSPLPPTVSAAAVGEQAVTSTRVQRFSRENFINYSVML